MGFGLRTTELASELRRLADDNNLIYDVARRSVEDALVDLRDSRISIIGRNNGLVIREKDGEESSTIRLGTDMAIAIALRSIADHIETEGTNAG